MCEACHLSINKTPIYGDNGSISPGGVRIGKISHSLWHNHCIIYYTTKKSWKICLALLFLFIKNKNIITGTPAMTTRGCVENDFETIADFLLRAAKIASNVVKEHGKIQKDFSRGLQNNNDIIELRNQVEAFASQFALPAFDV